MFKYLRHLPEIQDNAGFQGQVIHEAIAKALRGENWEDALAELAFDDIQDAKYKVLTALKYSKNLGNIVGIETKFAILDNGTITDFGDPDGFLRGIIDLLVEDPNGGLMIWDWKTGHSKPTKFQVFLYAWAVQKALNRRVSKVGYILLSSSEILDFEVSKEELEITERKLNKLVSALENDKDFRATPGGHCAYCSYVGMCPLVSLIEAKDIPTVRSDDEASEIAKKIKVLEEKLKKYEDALKGYVEETETGKVKIEDLRRTK
ncbi:MAG: PD-(D/E)XK nuclease family protein, partial [Thermotogae bacterium]|nr:PD-(D/E)XK nuclease family protein [Thermotogota bacterium]